MKNILVPIGTSENSASNLQFAIDLAFEMKAYVYVISVFQEVSKVGGLTKVNTIIQEDTKNRLDEVLSQVDRKDVPIMTHPIKGTVLSSIERFNKHVEIDLIVVSPRSNSINEEVFLGNITGKIVKGTNIPVLVVPEGSKFTSPKTMLLAFKNGTFNKNRILSPVKQLADKFKMEVNLLHVETPESTSEMKHVSGKLKKLGSTYAQTQNATTFQAVLEHFHANSPDMLCVVRRQRGFFKKLWEKNTVLKKEFHTSKPLLILQVQE